MCRPLLVQVYDSSEWYLKLMELQFKTWDVACVQVFNDRCRLIDSLAYHSPDVLVMEWVDESVYIDDLVGLFRSLDNKIKLVFLGAGLKSSSKLNEVHCIEKNDHTFHAIRGILKTYSNSLQGL